MRSAEKNLELCRKVVKEPWVSIKVKTSCGFCYKVGTKMDVLEPHGGTACLYDDHTSLNKTSHEQIELSAQFIVESSEALSHWINRAVEAERLLKATYPHLYKIYDDENQIRIEIGKFLGDGEG